MRRAVFAAAWLSVTAGASAFLALALKYHNLTVFLPGKTTSGHHQIESRCETCHDLGGKGVRQEACLQCHQQELTEADDSHPRVKFLDPRNASFLTVIDARRCVSCHVEHRPSITQAMGVSQPAGFCATCHEKVGVDRPSHRGLPFSGCADAGCHNYHDNRALREAFLADHLDEPDLKAGAVVPSLDRTRRGAVAAPLARSQADASGHVVASEKVLVEWASSTHAAAGVNCTGCHGGAPGASRAWTLHPALAACRECHESQAVGFLGGKHGMRVAVQLGAMRPELARLPMREVARGRELTCTSCHAAHRFDRRRAAVEACLECHADRHSVAYLKSPHYKLWKAESSQSSRQGSGVSCATCHLPRVHKVDTDRPGVTVEHNQNASLRPVETMLRPVCQTCHGVGYSLAALSDRALVQSNFRGKPAAPARAIEMVRQRKRGAAPAVAPPAKEEGR